MKIFTLHIFLCLCLLLGPSCASKHPQTEKKILQGVKTVRATNLEKEIEKFTEDTRFIRTLSWIEISDGSAERKTEAAIVIERPNKIRVDAMDELADVWAKAGSDGVKVWLFVPAKSKLYSGRATKTNLRRLADFDWEIPELVALLAGSPPLKDISSITETGKSGEWHFIADGGTIHIWVDKKTRLVAKCARYNLDSGPARHTSSGEAGGRMDYTAQFSDYKKIGNTWFPYKIEATFPDRGAKIFVVHHEWIPGNSIDPAIFSPPSSGGQKKVEFKD